MSVLLVTAGLSVLAYSTVTSATPPGPVQYCPIMDVCYQVGVPSSSADANSGNVYLQLRAPKSYSWVGFGTGHQMANSNIFVVYQDGTGNVTFSPRTGTGHVMPRYYAAAQVELLEGSGIIDDVMIANVRCGNCNTWPGGSVNLAGDAVDYIGAWKVGDAVDSADPDASIQYHDGHDEWHFDLTKSTVADDANPFVGVAQFDNNNRGVREGSFSDPNILIRSHGILMAIVMVLLYPIGSSLMPLFGKWKYHALWQLISFFIMWAGFGLGLVASQRIELDFNSRHILLGTVVASLMVLQPVFGWLHHRNFVKHQSRSPASYAHIWYGRALMVMGVVNGGLGMKLAGTSRKFIIIYSVVAGVMFVVYAGASGYGELYLKELKAYKPTPIKDSDSVGQVQTFSAPKTPKSPEEADLASSLKEYESMAVEVEGNEGATSSSPAVIEDWLVTEEEEETGAHH
ncbi:putative iron reductase domain protein [Hypoxylon sp. FL1150]|nr:putative iron reductase domain protein [Hypoxylon sp. FL1150]